MASDSQRQEGHDSTLSRLNLAINTLTIAKDISTIAPAQAAFGAVCALLTILRVTVLLFCGDRLLTHIYPGLHCQRRGLRRVGIALRRYLQSYRSRDEREETGRTQSVRVRGDKSVDDVSSTRVQLEMYCLGDPLMTNFITGPLRRSGARPQNIAGAAAFPDFSIQRTTRKRSLLGS